MSINKSVAEKLRNYLSNAYKDFNKDEKKYRCKIVNLELKDNDDVVWKCNIYGWTRVVKQVY